jgi:selenide,water dikinase
MAVVGTVSPGAVLANSTARPGDALILTKPIGTGVVSTALKRDAAPPELVQRAVDVMTTLNDTARDAALEVGVDAATDVTGFGLLGHLREVLVASGVAGEVNASMVPVIDGVRELLAAGMVAGGTQRNHAFVDPHVDWGTLAADDRMLLCDAQTSGGLLLAVAPERSGALLTALRRRDTLAAVVIGRTVEGPPGHIRVR